MRKIKGWEWVVLITPLLALGNGGCPLIPQIEEKTVQLATTGSTVLSFVAQGELNTHNDTQSVNLNTDVDLIGLLDKAGIDVSDVKDIKLSGVSYRVTKKDPTSNREIQNGNVTVTRGSTTQPIIADFDVVVNNVTDWTTAPVTQAGVDLINTLLGDMLAAVQNGTGVVTNPVLTFTVTGDSVPGNIATDFTYEIKVDVVIMGEVHVELPG
jgi:hypothetical protein